MIKARQIKAARAFLDWSQADVAEHAGLTKQTIANLESGHTKAALKSLQAIQETFERSGIRFTDTGVDMPAFDYFVIEGDGWYTKLQDHILTIPDCKELIVHMGDDRMSSADVIQRYRYIREAGIKMRNTVEFGNSYVMGTLDEYRWIPKAHYKNWVKLIYGDFVAMSLDEERKCIVMHDKDLAEAERNDFNLLWGYLEQPERSTAGERY